MNEAPIEYVGRTMMNVMLVFDKDLSFQETLREMSLDISLKTFLVPIVDKSGVAGEFMMKVYKELSQQYNLDEVNEDGFFGSWESLRWASEESMRGPKCGKCGTETKAILYGMPGEDFDFENFESGGCIVSDESPIWFCRNCGWQI